MADETLKTATVRLRVEGNDRVRRAMNGLVDETRSAQKKIQGERKSSTAVEKQAAKEEIAAAKAAARAGIEAQKAEARAARDASRVQAEEAKRAARVQMAADRESKQSAEKLAREKMALQRRVGAAFAQSIRDISSARRREEEASRKAAERELRATRRGRALAIAGGVAGAAMGVVAAGTRAQGVLGVRSQEEIVTSSIELRRGFIRAGRAGGLDRDQQNAMIQRSVEIGRSTDMSPEQILQAVTMAQENFSALGDAVAAGPAAVDAFMEGISRMAEHASATGAELSDVVNAGYAFQRQLNLNAQETQDALALIVKGAQDGSLSMRDFAEVFPGLLAGFSVARGQEGQGTQAVAEFAALAQALKASDVNAATSATLMTNLFSAFGNVENVRRIERTAGVRRAGIRLTEVDTDENGVARKDARGREVRRLRNVGDIISDLAGVDDAGLQGMAVNTLVHDQQGRQALTALLNAERTATANGGESLLSSLQYRDQPGEAPGSGLQRAIDAGNALTDVTNRDLGDDASGRAVRLRVGREADILGNSEALIDHFASIAEPLTALEDRFPELTQAMKDLAGVITGAGIGAGMMGALGANAAGGGIAAKMLGMVGLGGGGAAAAGAGSMVLPALLAGGAGLGIGAGISSMWGEDIDEWISDATGLSAELGPRTQTRGLQAGGEQVLADGRRILGKEASSTKTSVAIDQPVRLAPETVEAIGRSVSRNTQVPGAGRRADGSPGGR